MCNSFNLQPASVEDMEQEENREVTQLDHYTLSFTRELLPNYQHVIVFLMTAM